MISYFYCQYVKTPYFLFTFGKKLYNFLYRQSTKKLTTCDPCNVT